VGAVHRPAPFHPHQDGAPDASEVTST
jgi:hypothetical protein